MWQWGISTAVVKSCFWSSLVILHPFCVLTEWMLFINFCTLSPSKAVNLENSIIKSNLDSCFKKLFWRILLWKWGILTAVVKSSFWSFYCLLVYQVVVIQMFAHFCPVKLFNLENFIMKISNLNSCCEKLFLVVLRPFCILSGCNSDVCTLLPSKAI